MIIFPSKQTGIGLPASNRKWAKYKSTMKALRRGTLKAIFVAANTPSIVKAEINYYSLLANTHVYPYVGNNIDLGSACGRYHRVAVLGIQDAGDSDILTLFESK